MLLLDLRDKVWTHHGESKFIQTPSHTHSVKGPTSIRVEDRDGIRGMIHDAFGLYTPMSSSEPLGRQRENVQTNLVRGRGLAQFTTISNIPLSLQNQRLRNSLIKTQQQSRRLEDDEEDDDDLRDGETQSQHSQIPEWNDTIESDEQEKVQIRGYSRGFDCKAMIDSALAKDVEDEKYQRIVGHGVGGTYNQVFGVDREIRKRGCVLRDNASEEVVMLRA
ncbi:hypothetical protein Cgig2_032328 [Carnegiea gigantea]|uniref:Uncharacterized protein n=1 Tax=Carnegiea gigantea TaxID=171969 RepID=A0A9Q1KHM4_9CARY|nr:hypothetical protein Cgig2_032328 [Carnegiea gigantea]